METYSVAAVVENFDLANEAQLAGLDCLSYPAIVGSTGGIVSVDAEITADSPISALTQLASDLRHIGTSVMRFDADLVTISEIALRLDVSREAVRLWSQGKRRGGFPVAHAMAGEAMLWRWSDVYPWALAQELDVDEAVPVPGDVLDAYNGAFAQLRSSREEGWFSAITQPQRPIMHLDHKRQSRPAARWVSPRVGQRDVG